MTSVKSSVALFATLLWVGFICAISFMEAWLKFQAPGITVSLGLGVGRLVFNALNKVEWVFALIILIDFLRYRYRPLSFISMIYFTTVFLLIIQTFWLLPVLDARAEMHIQGQDVSPSNMHIYYVAMEFVKVFCLITLGITILKK